MWRYRYHQFMSIAYLRLADSFTEMHNECIRRGRYHVDWICRYSGIETVGEAIARDVLEAFKASGKVH